jgi:hypothetical protein
MKCPVTLELTKEKINAKHKMVLIGDSHARGCASKLREKLKKQYEVIGYVVLGGDTAVLTKTAQQEIEGLAEEHILIYCVGTIDIMKNNTSKGIKFIHHYLLKNCHTNTIFLGVPHRYDLMETSIVNEEVKFFNKKLYDVTCKYRNTSVMHIDLAREDFTSHGLHLWNSGTDKLVTLLIGRIEMHLQKTQAEMPISVAWKEDTTINITEGSIANYSY